MDSKPRRPTTPEEEGIELYPDAMERTERAIKAAFRTGQSSARTAKKVAAPEGRKVKRAASRP
jgi:hypothetical protein